MAERQPYSSTAPLTAPTPKIFLHHWKKAVQKIGPSYFSGKGINPDQITHWRQLTPCVKVLHKAVTEKPTSTAAFIACVVGFYNAEEGERMQRKVGCNGIGKLIDAMNQYQRDIVATLILSKQEW